MENNSGNFILPPKTSNKKTLVIDLDETLIHSQFLPFSFPSDVVLNMNIENESHNINVLIRPGAKEFIKKMQKFYEIIIFTASVPKYAMPLMDIIDEKKYCQNRLFREHCTLINNAYVKDLKKLGRELKDIVIVDNSPLSYSLNPENGIPVGTWIEDKRDRELYNLMPILEFLSGVNDVREFIPKIVFNNEISYYASRDIIKKYNDNIKKNQNKIEIKNNDIPETNMKIENNNKILNNGNNVNENKVNNKISENKYLTENKESKVQKKDNKKVNNSNIEKVDKNINSTHFIDIPDSIKKVKLKRKINKSVKTFKKEDNVDNKKLEINNKKNNSKMNHAKIKSNKKSTSTESKLKKFKTMRNIDNTQTSRNQNNKININKTDSIIKIHPFPSISNKLIDSKLNININKKTNYITRSYFHFNYKHKKQNSVITGETFSIYKDNQNKDLITTTNIEDLKFTPKRNRKVLYLKTAKKSKINNYNEKINKTAVSKYNKKLQYIKDSRNFEIFRDDLSSLNSKFNEIKIYKKISKTVAASNSQIKTLTIDTKSKSLKKTLYDNTISSGNKIKRRKNTEGRIVRRHNKLVKLTKKVIFPKEYIKKSENKKDNKIENKNEKNKQKSNIENDKIKNN